VRTFCGDCHAFPKPDSFPKDAWNREVTRGFEFYNMSGRSDLTIPRKADVLRWYRSKAQVAIRIPEPVSAESDISFHSEHLDFSEHSQQAGVAGLRLLATRSGATVFVSDMLNGTFGRLFRSADKWELSRMVAAGNPCHIEVTDLDSNGVPDYLVADLGSSQPEDHQLGRVLWIRQADDVVKMTVLADRLGRVADVRPADFDSDGDLDLIVAEFGWLETGRVLLLENLGSRLDVDLPDPKANWKQHIVDPRHGTIHVPVIDLDGDGRLDFVALVSQEHEAVDAFLNEGELKFRKVRLWAALDPSFGSSGIELVDFDLDGDTDVLYSNGDTLDSFYLKPYHGILWLENAGEFPFVPHNVARMPGVSRALPADLDGDGDLDIAACGMIPWDRLQDVTVSKLDALLWLENDGSGNFKRHSLSQSRQGYMAMEVGDLDADGDVDLVVGAFGELQSGQSGSVSVWWNQSSKE
jgi:hypothetical protein